ncbi:MAG: type II toxin-antitoxin system Phd/YefM family antitoxin [Spirochaetota bacterium]
MKVSATELRQNLYRIIDSVIATGEPVEVERKHGMVRIVPEEKRSIWDALEVHDIVAGDVEADWTDAWDGEAEIEAP